MTGKTKLVYSFYLYTAILLAVILTGLRVAVTLRTLDPLTGYFDANSPLVRAANVLTVVAVVFLLTLPASLGRKMNVRAVTPHMPTVFSSAFAAFMMLAFGAYHFCEILRVLRGPGEAPIRIVLCSGIAVLLSVFGVIAFIRCATDSTEVRARKGSALLAVVLFAVLYTMYLYFEKSLPLNADVKIIAQVALLLVAVFFLYEARIALGRPMWAIRSSFGMIAMVLTLSASVPNLIYYLYHRTSVLDSPIHDFLLFAFFLYIFTRLHSLTDREEQKTDAFFDEVLAEESTDTESTTAEQISFFGTDEDVLPQKPKSRDGDAEDPDDIFRSPDSDNGDTL